MATKQQLHALERSMADVSRFLRRGQGPTNVVAGPWRPRAPTAAEKSLARKIRTLNAKRAVLGRLMHQAETKSHELGEDGGNETAWKAARARAAAASREISAINRQLRGLGDWRSIRGLQGGRRNPDYKRRITDHVPGGKRMRKKRKNPWLLRGANGKFAKTGTPAWVRKRKRAKKSKVKEKAYRKAARARYRRHAAFLGRLKAKPAATKRKKRAKQLTLRGTRRRPPQRRPRQLGFPGVLGEEMRAAARRRNPKRKSARRGRRKMPAGLRRYWAARKAGRPIRRSHKRRRNPSALLVNPRRRAPAMRKRRRRNPGLGGVVQQVAKTAVPALAVGAALGALDVKMSKQFDKPATFRLVSTLAKLGVGVGALIGLKNKPQYAIPIACAAFAGIGNDLGVKMVGGIVGGSKEATAKELAGIAAEDEETFGLLLTEMQGMGILSVSGMGNATNDAAAAFEGTEPIDVDGYGDF